MIEVKRRSSKRKLLVRRRKWQEFRRAIILGVVCSGFMGGAIFLMHLSHRF